LHPQDITPYTHRLKSLYQKQDRFFDEFKALQHEGKRKVRLG